MDHLSNPSLTISTDARHGFFSFLPALGKLPSIQNARLRIEYVEKDRLHCFSLENWQLITEKSRRLETIEHGELDQVTYAVHPEGSSITCEVTFAVPLEYPLCLWKLKVQNSCSEPIRMRKIALLEMEQSGESKIDYSKAESPVALGFFSNGWQSWSPTRFYRGDERMRISRLGSLQHPMIYNPGTPLPRKKGVFSSDMFAVVGDRIARTGFLIGFLSQKEQFGSIFADLNASKVEMWANGDSAQLNPDCSMETDWAVFTPILLDHRAPMESYFEAVARENHSRVPADAPVGWCSWYYYYTKLAASDIQENLQVLGERQEDLPVELVQIDDGFEKQVGDWFSFSPGFPDGVKPLAEKISKEGLVPGLWLAPFIVHPKSEIMRDHPDWILRRKNGNPVNAGFVWNTMDTAFDLTVPQALEYACSVVRTAAEKWGFPYLKLDFLYAAALNGCYQDSTKTRAQVLRKGMEAIRDAVGPQVTLLGCGAPLGSMLGIVDAMRIGPDVSGDWDPKFHNIGLLIKNEPSFPSARNSIRNILSRAGLHRLWWINDPDCLLIREESNLTSAEVKSLATAIAITGGSLLLSDDLTRVSKERMRIAEVLLPVLTERARIPNWFDSRDPDRSRVDLVNETGESHLLAFFNWEDRPMDIDLNQVDWFLPGVDYVCREFWGGTVHHWKQNEALKMSNIPAHGCVLLSVRRKVADDTPLYLGGDLHFSQSNEVNQWLATSESISSTFRLPRNTRGKVDIYIPWNPKQMEVDGIPAIWKNKDRIYSIQLKVNGFANLKIWR